MGYDVVLGPDTYGSGCMPGMKRQFDWWMNEYDAGTLGCYNPASLQGRSLHAEGRAIDIALNAHDPDQRLRGDRIFDLVMTHPDWFGAQEMLWRGYIWSWQRRGEGKRGPGIQQADHMNHVHLGIDVYAAKNWTREWVGIPESEEVREEAERRKRGYMEGQIYTFIDQKDKGDVEISVQHMGGTAHDKDNYMRLLPAETWAKVVAGAVPIRLFRREFDAFVAGELDTSDFGARAF